MEDDFWRAFRGEEPLHSGSILGVPLALEHHDAPPIPSVSGGLFGSGGECSSKRKSKSALVNPSAPKVTRRTNLNPGSVLDRRVPIPQNSGQSIVREVENMAREVNVTLNHQVVRTQEHQGTTINYILQRLMQLEQRSMVNTLETNLSPKDHNLIPWIWVLMNMGLQLRMIQVNMENRLCIDEEAVSKVAIKAMDFPARNPPFTLLRYIDFKGRVRSDRNSMPAWKKKAEQLFGDMSSVTKDYMLQKAHHIMTHPTYHAFGVDLGQTFMREALSQMRESPNYYFISKTIWQTVYLKHAEDVRLLQHMFNIHQPTVVTVSDGWKINVN
jgi:hypothetical protein